MAKIAVIICLLAPLVDGRLEEIPPQYDADELYNMTSTAILQHHALRNSELYKEYSHRFNAVISSFDDKLTNITGSKVVLPEHLTSFPVDIQTKVIDQTNENFKDYANIGISWFNITPQQLGFENKEELCRQELLAPVCEDNYVLPEYVQTLLASLAPHKPESSTVEPLKTPMNTASKRADVLTEKPEVEKAKEDPVPSEVKEGEKGGSNAMKSAWILTLISIIASRHSWTITWY